MRGSCILVILLMSYGCKNVLQPEQASKAGSVSFVEHKPEESGFLFNNILDEEKLVNPFSYVNAYNGGGVGIGDFNNDGLQDIVMTGNMVPSKLFFNKGHLRFEDVTQKAGFQTKNWCTGVAIADVNNDGWLDIYVCRSYYDDPAQKRNLFFQNNGDGTFTERAAELGIADENYSIAASFFDYDRDGDLDLIVANHPRDRIVSPAVHYNYWVHPVLKFSSRLFRNDDGHFTDVTSDSGILSYGFCLGVVTSDLNADGWPDIYLSVDHDEPDLIFYNNGDGTFRNVSKTAVKQTSRSSMGIDAGDLDHNLFPDVVVVEMLSEDHFREKVIMSMQSVDKFQFFVDSLGYTYYQMRNFLHQNNGNGTFSDVAQLAGIHKTDWSWSAFFFDADNDSWQDLYVSNGYYRDIYNNDLFKPFDQQMRALGNDMAAKNRLASDYARSCPQTKIPNYFFRNTGQLLFENKTTAAGLGRPTISTGGAYGDLDNDGDLDLVINNLGEPSLLYENTSGPGNHYLRVKFAPSENVAPLGGKVIVSHQGTVQIRELLTTRGYQASCEPYAHFGLGKASVVDEVKVIWPDGKMQVLENVPADQVLGVHYEDATEQYTPPVLGSIVAEISPEESGLNFSQRENPFNDYNDQVLLPHKMSEQGPFISVADVNADGLEDLFIGAPHGQAGALFFQKPGGRFAKSHNPVFDEDKDFEDTGSAFFDADGDGDLDLLVASGSYEWPADDPHYQPRLYLNNGTGLFSKASSLPQWHSSASCVRPVDIDADGDMDLFIGGRQNPKRYPEPGRSALFVNNGDGSFSNATPDYAPELEYAGMVKDAQWTDLNQDGKPDLVVCGEWMPVSVWIQTDGKLLNQTEQYLPDSPVGWWNCLQMADLDGNGLPDIVAGNLGLNYKYKASPERPFSVYAADFDDSGTFDIVLGAYYGDVMYPVRGRTCSSQQIPDIKLKFPTFTDYAKADLRQVYGTELENALHYDATNFASVVFYQETPGKFTMVKLPLLAQRAPINGIVIFDINNDQQPDLITAGNLYQSEIETGRADAGTGNILLNMGQHQWKALTTYETGLYLAKDLKSLEMIMLGSEGKPALLAGNNKAPLQLVLLKPATEF